MISFDSGGYRFNLRAGGVAVHPSNGRFLLHRTIRDPFWTLPGGRCDAGETGAEALKREMAEELGVSVQVGRLLFVGESFFTYGRRLHELNFIYAMDLAKDAAVLQGEGPFSGIEVGTIPLIFDWVDIDAVRRGETLPILPTFLRDALAERLPEAPRHIVGVELEGVPGAPLPTDWPLVNHEP